MKTVNLTVDESLWKAARAEAGRRDMYGLSTLMRAALEEHFRAWKEAESEENRQHRLVDLLEECQIVRPLMSPPFVHELLGRHHLERGKPGWMRGGLL